MLKITQTIIVEGKHDRVKLKSVTDANIITTDGFRIYNNAQKRALIKKIAENTGIIILTDSDNAGRRIRNFIKSCIGDNPNAEILNVYVPESTFGVEGTDKAALVNALERFGAKHPPPAGGTLFAKEGKDGTDLTPALFCKEGGSAEPGVLQKQIAKLDFYNDGLSGGKNSRKMREYLCSRLGIPYMAANALLECVNILINYGEYKKIVHDAQNNIKKLCIHDKKI